MKMSVIKSWNSSGRLSLLVVCIVTTLLAGCSNPQMTAMDEGESGVMVGSAVTSGSQHALSNSRYAISLGAE